MKLKWGFNWRGLGFGFELGRSVKYSFWFCGFVFGPLTIMLTKPLAREASDRREGDCYE